MSDATSAGGLPDSNTDTELLFDETHHLVEGTYHAVVYSTGFDSITYGTDSDTNVDGNNYTGESPPSTWLASGTEVELGLLGCTL